MVRKTIYFLLLTFTPILSFGQFDWEIGGQAGIGNYLGDIGGEGAEGQPFLIDMKLDQTRWAIGAYGRYRALDNVYIAAGANWIRLEGDDKLSVSEESLPRRTRNASFRNELIEIYARGEYAFFNIHDVGHTGRYLLDFKAYIYAGIGMIISNPMGYYNPTGADGAGTWIALQPLTTEGTDIDGNQNPYSLVHMAFPIGGGISYTWKKQHRIGFELGWRLTTTDYLDDVGGDYGDPSNLSAEGEYFYNIHEQGEGWSSLGEDIKANFGYRGEGTPHNKRSNDMNDNYVVMQFTYGYILKGKYKNKRFRTTRKGIHGLGNYKKRRRKSKAKF